MILLDALNRRSRDKQNHLIWPQCLFCNTNFNAGVIEELHERFCDQCVSGYLTSLWFEHMNSARLAGHKRGRLKSDCPTVVFKKFLHPFAMLRRVHRRHDKNWKPCCWGDARQD